MLCILYTIAVGACLSWIGVLLDRLLPARVQRRWLWLSIVVLSITIPPLYRAKHMAAAPASWAIVGSLDPLVMQVWHVATWVLLGWALPGALRAWWLVRRENAASTSLDGVRVVLTDALGPATVGVFRSRVVVPRWIAGLPREKRAYVLRHEEEHRRAHDTQLLFLSSLVLVLVPWYVPLYWQLRQLSIAVEKDCDARVVASLGDAREYGALLLDIAEAGSNAPRLQPSFLGSAGSLERRLIALLAPRELTPLQRVLLPLAAIALLTAVLYAPHPMVM